MRTYFFNFLLWLFLCIAFFLPAIDFFIGLALSGAPTLRIIFMSILSLAFALLAFYKAFCAWLSIYRTLTLH